MLRVEGSGAQGLLGLMGGGRVLGFKTSSNVQFYGRSGLV